MLLLSLAGLAPHSSRVTMSGHEASRLIIIAAPATETCKTLYRPLEYQVLVGTCEGCRPLGRRRIRWKGNIKTDVIGMELEPSIHEAQDGDHLPALVNTAVNLRVP
jgi:hypothetical protein